MKTPLTFTMSGGYWLTEIFQNIYLSYLQLLCSALSTATTQFQKTDHKSLLKVSLLGFKH